MSVQVLENGDWGRCSKWLLWAYKPGKARVSNPGKWARKEEKSVMVAYCWAGHKSRANSERAWSHGVVSGEAVWAPMSHSQWLEWAVPLLPVIDQSQPTGCQLSCPSRQPSGKPWLLVSANMGSSPCQSTLRVGPTWSRVAAVFQTLYPQKSMSDCQGLGKQSVKQRLMTGLLGEAEQVRGGAPTSSRAMSRLKLSPYR